MVDPSEALGTAAQVAVALAFCMVGLLLLTTELPPRTVWAWSSGALQLYNVVSARAFWPFFALIVVAILASILQFVRMILARPRSE
jgi:hypothetical protein